MKSGRYTVAEAGNRTRRVEFALFMVAAFSP